jgi:FkbM family methyltransferase
MRWLVAIGGFLRVFARLKFLSAIRFFLARCNTRMAQIRVRDYAEPVFIRGCSSDAWVLETVIICREYAGLFDFVPKTIIDGGANIGLASVFWHKEFPDANIVAVEPDGGNLKLAELNTKCFDKVKILKGGLWSQDCMLSICNEGDENYALRVIEDRMNGTIAGRSIDSIMSEYGWSFVDVLKLDIEGAEVELLSKNIESWIDRVNVLIIELHPRIAPNGAEVLFKAFAGRHFDLRWHGEDLVISRRPRIV